MVIASVIGLFVLSISLVPSGIVATTFADVVEGDFVTATLEMPAGTPAQRTYEVATELEQAGRRVLERLERERPDDAPPLLTGVTITVGQGPRVEGGGLDPTPTLNPQANVAAIEFKLLSAQQRDLSSIAIVQAWREQVGILPYVVGLAFSGEVIDLGNPVEAVLSRLNPAKRGQPMPPGSSKSSAALGSSANRPSVAAHSPTAKNRLEKSTPSPATVPPGESFADTTPQLVRYGSGRTRQQLGFLDHTRGMPEWSVRVGEPV